MLPRGGDGERAKTLPTKIIKPEPPPQSTSPCHRSLHTPHISEPPPAARSRFERFGRSHCGPRALSVAVAHLFLVRPTVNRTSRKILGAACVLAAWLCLAGCDRHAFEPGDQVRRKLNREIRATVTLRLNLDGKQDTYFIAWREGDHWAEHGPVLAEDLERVP
jgi:hypothetical protein